MRIKIFNKMAVSSDNSLKFGPEPQAGLRHGVPVMGAHSSPSCSGSGPRFYCEALHWPITKKRPAQNSPTGCSQVSWEAKPPCSTFWRSSLSQFCILLLASEHDCPLLMTMDLYLKSSDTIFLTSFVIEIFISCTRVLMACSGPWWGAPPGWTVLLRREAWRLW